MSPMPRLPQFDPYAWGRPLPPPDPEEVRVTDLSARLTASLGIKAEAASQYDEMTGVTSWLVSIDPDDAEQWLAERGDP